MALSRHQKELVCDLALVSVASAAAGAATFGLAPALIAGAAGQAYMAWLNRVQTTLKSHPETEELVRTLGGSLRRWAAGELAERDNAEITAGLELAVQAVANNGFGWDELVHAHFDPRGTQDALYADAAAGRSDRSAALWAGLKSTASALALRLFDHEASEALLDRIVHTDSELYSNRSSRYTAQTVTTYLERDPTRLAHIERVWASVPQAAQAAVAEALDCGLIPGKETTAQRLLNIGADSHSAARLLNIVETGGSRSRSL